MEPEDNNAADEHRTKMQQVKARQDAEVRRKQVKRGIVVVNDGDGKGKSTAAFGMAIRAAGHGQRVGIVQFIKGTWRTGEREMFKRIPEIDHVTSGEGFTWNTQDQARDRAAAEHGLTLVREMIDACRGDEPRYGVVILDEINVALSHGQLELRDVLDLVRSRPTELTMVLTGRNAAPELIDLADTVTRMEVVKHAFQAGIRARKGVDF